MDYIEKSLLSMCGVETEEWETCLSKPSDPDQTTCCSQDVGS